MVTHAFIAEVADTRMRGYWVLALLVLPVAQAATLDAEYDLGLTQTDVTYRLADVQNLTVPLPYDVQQLTINGEVREAQDQVRLTQDATLTFTSSAYTSRANYFVVDLAGIDAQIHEVTVYLPEGARLLRGLSTQDPSIHPAPADAFTDGEQLIFSWNGENLEPARALIVDFETNIPGPEVLLALGAALLLAGIIVVLTGRRKPGEEALTRNLYEEEKRIMQVLLAQKDEELWQKQVARETGLSKVKVSRKLRNLEKKGLIEKIPHGNTNKIRVKRPE